MLEIGPGTGQATGPLLDLGAEVVAVELGPELAQRLRDKNQGRALEVVVGAFEDIDIGSGPIEPGTFDMVTAATSFHWVPPEVGLDRCADLLRADGWLALWWNVFGDESRPDPFHEAIQPLLERRAPQLKDPAAGGLGAHPHALEVDIRRAEIDAVGRFGEVRHELMQWTGRHTTMEVRTMFASFSPWLAVEPVLRASLLDDLAAIADDEFGGLVERPYVTSLFLARKRDA